MTSLNPPDAMITYRRVDGELIYGEFSFALHPDSLDEDFSDEPVEYYEEIWTLLECKTIVKFPRALACGMSPDCDNDAEKWVKRTVDGIQKWIEACEEHLEERDQQDHDDDGQEDVGGVDSHSGDST